MVVAGNVQEAPMSIDGRTVAAAKASRLDTSHAVG